MNDKPRPDIIGLDDMVQASDGDMTTHPLFPITLQLVNLLQETFAPLRKERPMELEGPLITALVMYAGAIHGELLAMGAAPDITEEATAAMLQMNWRAGQCAGRNKVNDLAAELGVDPVTGKAPE